MVFRKCVSEFVRIRIDGSNVQNRLALCDLNTILRFTRFDVVVTCLRLSPLKSCDLAEVLSHFACDARLS